MNFDGEVAVVGVGTMGSLSLWQLARQGVRAVGFEQFNPGHDRSGAGGESRIFRTAYLEGSHYVPLLRESRAQWNQLEADSGVPLLHMNSGLMIGDGGSRFMRNVMESISDHDVKHEVLTSAAMATRYPQHALTSSDIAVLDRESGYLRPELAVAIAADTAERRGSTIHRHERVIAVEEEGDGVRITTQLSEYRFRRAIVASGAWANKLLPGTTPKLDIRRLIMTWFPTKSPELFSPERFPIFVRQSNGFNISGWPTLDGASVKVGLNFGYDEVLDPDNVDRNVKDELLDLIRAAVREQLPDIIPEPVRIGVYMDGYTSDSDGVVGFLPGSDRIVVMTGFSGHGFKLASALGRAAADLVMNGETSLPISYLSPQRFAYFDSVDRAIERKESPIHRNDAQLA